MMRKILAFFAFNVYSLFLISAFQENTAYLFDNSLINEIRLQGIKFNPCDLGWGGHYIWRLFSSVVVTAFAGLLSGTISKTNGNKTAALGNIPSVLVWLAMIYIFGFENVDVEGKVGFIIISIIAIPLTLYVAYIFGGIGELLQSTSFPEDTVLGVRGYHWIWAIYPIYWYARGIVFVATKFIGFEMTTLADNSIFSALISLLLLIPIITWIYPLIIVHRVLSGKYLSSQHTVIRGLANFGILVAGMFIAVCIQFCVFWILSKIPKLWSK